MKIKEGALAKARADLEHCTIKSPVDGEVISRNVDVGQTVAASLQAPVLFTIANDLTKMHIDAAVAEADVGQVAVDQNVDFTVDAFPNRTFRGKVVQVRNAPTTVQNVVTYDTVIDVDNSELKLKPGMTASVSIIIAHKEDVLKVSNAAFRYRPPEAATATPEAKNQPPTGGRAGQPAAQQRERRTDRTVYVMESSRPRPVRVKIGISDGVNTEVDEGVKEGDRVVTASLRAGASATAHQANPFGGGGRRF
jgi:HlyD family secretion protein